MQSATTGKVRVFHWARGAHDLTIFQVWKQKEIVRALRKLANCETLLKNLVGNAGLAVCLRYDYVYKYKYGCIFWDETCVRILWIWFKFVCNA